MKSMVLRSITILAVLLLIPTVIRASDAAVVLYQTNIELTQRLGDDVAPFAKYIKNLEAVAGPFLGKDQPELFDIFVILKPGGVGPFQRSRAWFVSSVSPPAAREKLKQALEEVPPPEVTEGPVVFALCYALNGAKPRDLKSGSDKPPFPEEWKRQVPGLSESSEISSTVLKNVWPD